VLRPHGGRTWIKTLSVSCVTIEFVACAPSTDKLLSWVYPKVDCRLAFIDKRPLEQAQPSIAKKLKVGAAPKDSGECFTFLSIVLELCDPYVELLSD
jgi:hypothetical protein